MPGPGATMPSLPRASTPERPGRSTRKRPPFRGPVVCLLLCVVVLTSLAPAVRADEAVTDGRDTQRLPLKQTQPVRDGSSLALNAPELNSPPIDELKHWQFAVELIDLPAAFTPGRINKVRIKISATGEHELPASPPGVRDLSIDLRLLDATGRELYRRAAIKTSRAVAELSFAIPADAVGPVTVLADLNYSPVARRSTAVDLGQSELEDPMTRLASTAGEVPLSRIRPAAAELMRRLLLLLSLGRSR
jgi:hypothetical protein